jgi:putative heme-binding domain-containing protein
MLLGFGTLFLALAALIPSTAPGQDPFAAHIASSNPRSPEEERKGFHVPPGFEVQLVAAEPEVRKPINMNFDDRGRLWVTESVEYPFPSTAARPRDTIRIYEIEPQTGHARNVTTFTDGLNIPIGVLPIRDGAIAYSIPNVYFFRNDGHDHAAGRELLCGSIGYRDTHGMTGEFTRGFDGWVYACHGFSNTSQVRARDGSHITMRSGNVYRFKPDGTHIEQITHGQVNPFGLTFDPLGNLYSCDCHSRPIYQLLRGAYYPSFGAPHDGLGFGPEVMTHDHGSTAIAGITYYAADHFPPEYRDTVFIGNVVTNRINHDRLERHGSTVRAILQPDFLSSGDPWFRPVDIKLGPDGALYVADFYNRIIGHYEVPLTHPGRDHERGRIWRIIYRGPDGKSQPPRQPRPDWSKGTIDELVADLAHPNLTVRLKATNQLADRGDPATAAAIRKVMNPLSNPFQRMHGLWVLARLGVLTDRELEAAANDLDPGVRTHAMRILAEEPTLSTVQERLAVTGLRDTNPNVQRAAADALGTHPDPRHVRPLLDLRPKIRDDDTHLLHMVRMSLRNQFRPAGALARLPVSSLNEADARAVADVVPGVHTIEAAEFLLRHLEKYPENSANQIRFANHIARYGTDALEDRLLAVLRNMRSGGLKQQVALFRAIREGNQARGAVLSAKAQAWGGELADQLLGSRDRSEVVAGIELAGALKRASAKPQFIRIATSPTAPESLRSAAMSALMSMDTAGQIPLLGRIVRDASTPIKLREKAAHLLAGANRPAAVAELVSALPTAPERLAVVIANGLANASGGIEQLVKTVAAGKASAHLLKERGIELRLGKMNAPALKAHIADLTRNLPSPDKRLQELYNRRRSGFQTATKNLALGAQVFEKNCAVCHTLANKGAKIGPQLDGIGTRGLDRLMEDILDPSRNVDQAFRVTSLYLNSGQIISGLLLREEGQVYVLADNQGKEVRVPKKDVEERTLSQLSPMPANFADQLPEADFYNLLAFLLAQQQPKDGPMKSPLSAGSPGNGKKGSKE